MDDHPERCVRYFTGPPERCVLIASHEGPCLRPMAQESEDPRRRSTAAALGKFIDSRRYA